MKRNIYIALVVILGALCGVLASALLERALIISALSGGSLPFAYMLGKEGCWQTCLWFILLALGAAGGFFLGRMWWRIVYIEKRHWRKGWRKPGQK